VKLLLTSAGIRNRALHAALVDLLPKPIAECTALCITTASYGHPYAGPGRAFEFVGTTEQECPMVELGWKSVGLIELAVLPSLSRDLWLPWMEQADVFLVNGGDATFLAHWMRASGLAELLPSLNAVWVGLSGGSMAMSPRIGREFVNWPSDGADDEALGIVDFAIFPHLDNPGLEWNTIANAEKWAAKLEIPSYAIDDETAIVWVDGAVDVVSEGIWRKFDQ
jgi:dipeptidase E